MSKKITSFYTSADTSSVSNKDSGTSHESTTRKGQRGKKSSRTLKSGTISKWIDKDLAKTNPSVWLKHEDNGKGEVLQMKCSICTKFQKKIQQNRDFSDAWINGTSNRRLSNARDHSETKCHQHAYRLYVNDLNAKGECVNFTGFLLEDL